MQFSCIGPIDSQLSTVHSIQSKTTISGLTSFFTIDSIIIIVTFQTFSSVCTVGVQSIAFFVYFPEQICARFHRYGIFADS